MEVAEVRGMASMSISDSVVVNRQSQRNDSDCPSFAWQQMLSFRNTTVGKFSLDKLVLRRSDHALNCLNKSPT